MTWTCRSCTTAYSVGAPACPHCGSTDHEETGDMGAKITRHGGPSHTEDVAVDDGTEQEGEQSSPGNSSSPSDEKPQTSGSTSSPAAQPPARTAASRSGTGRTGASGAGSTAGAKAVSRPPGQ